MNMISLSLAVLGGLGALLGDVVEDGEAWIQKAEGRLYRWPKLGAVVSFRAQTDVLDGMVATIRKELAKKPDADGAKALEALARVEIRGTVDTDTGRIAVDVDLPDADVDARWKKTLETTRQRLTASVSGVLQGLPLHDSRLLQKGSTVVGVEERGDQVLVTVTGKLESQQSTFRLNRRRLLPEAMEAAAFTLHFGYSEILPGRFAPAHLEVRPRSGPETRMEYVWQRVGEILFPSSVRVTSGTKTATVRFESVSLKPR